MVNFAEVVAAPSIQLAAEKGLLGKPYIRLGKLIATVAASVFQWGGVLGYALTGQPVLLSKIYTDVSRNIRIEQFAEALSGTRGLVEKDLDEAGRHLTLFDLYAGREYLRLGINVVARSVTKELDRKMDMEAAWNVILPMFARGIAFGYHFPTEFKEQWERTHRMALDSEWQDVRAHGLPLPAAQPTMPLNAAIATMAELALGWDAGESHRLDTNEIQLLDSLAGR
jgi:hypothetical protein